MSESTFFISEAAVRHFKQKAQLRAKHVSSGHLTESLAAAFGFNSNAALRSVLRGQATVEVPKPRNRLMVSRLNALGYDFGANCQLIPELRCSYTPFADVPLRRRYGVRWWAWRNVMVSAINEALERRLFGLSPGENWWAGRNVPEDKLEVFVFHFLFDHDLPAVASIHAISGDELSISVVLRPKLNDLCPQNYSGLLDGDAAAHGWFERRFGAWIQDGGEGFHCKRTLLQRLAVTVTDTTGYADRGSFFM